MHDTRSMPTKHTTRAMYTCAWLLEGTRVTKALKQVILESTHRTSLGNFSRPIPPISKDKPPQRGVAVQVICSGGLTSLCWDKLQRRQRNTFYMMLTECVLHAPRCSHTHTIPLKLPYNTMRRECTHFGDRATRHTSFSNPSRKGAEEPKSKQLTPLFPVTYFASWIFQTCKRQPESSLWPAVQHSISPNYPAR